MAFGNDVFLSRLQKCAALLLVTIVLQSSAEELLLVIILSYASSEVPGIVFHIDSTCFSLLISRNHPMPKHPSLFYVRQKE